jgi:hypothetical protein
MSILNQLSKDVQDNHSLYCTSTDYAQFYLLDTILTSLGKFKVSNIVLIDPRGISHNPWKHYLQNMDTEMVLNDFTVLSKSLETFGDPSIDVITDSLKEEFGESYPISLAKIIEPTITRYELEYKESKLTLYHINYDVAATLLLLQQMNNQEHYSSTCSTGLLLNSIVGDWGVVSHDAIQSYLIKTNFKPHYVISNNYTLIKNFTRPIQLIEDLTISFETPFLREYFETLRKLN